MPSFSGGDTAPHYVYDPTSREWTMWAEYEDGAVGTLKGHSSACHGNCQAFQVEIIAYSDNRYSPWVGDFTEENMQDLADFFTWARERYGIGNAVTVQPADGWLYGVDSPYRMTCAEWDGFSGLTAHGAVPQNTHWDTGVLDLYRIYNLSQHEEEPVLTHFRIGDETAAWEPVLWLLFKAAGGIMSANEPSSQIRSLMPWKNDLRLVEAEDIELLCDVLMLGDENRQTMIDSGLYKFGLELSALKVLAYK